MAKEKVPAGPAEPQVARLQNFAVERWNRQQINKATYNPRSITPSAQKTLAEGLKRDGLVMPLVVNRRNGNLIAGHQRLDILDKSEKTLNYLLDVSVVDLDEKAEKAINVFLNNDQAQGYFDEDALASLMNDIDFDPATGYDAADFRVMFGMEQTEAATEALNRINEDTRRLQEIDAGAAPETITEVLPEHKPKKESFSSLIGNKTYGSKVNRERERVKAEADPEFYLYVVFRTRDEKEEFMRTMGHDETDRFVNGSKLFDTIRALMAEEETPNA